MTVVEGNRAPISEFGGEVCVLLPCYNEEAVIASVIAAFREHLPHARIFVFDNNSTDGTSAQAQEAGAIVIHEPLQGKGQVVRRMFADIDAEIYVLCDGDGTYDATAAPRMIAALVDGQLDMVTGTRRADDARRAYRPGHVAGNKLITRTAAMLFQSKIGDMLSGYRVLSRRYVKSFPSVSRGFEIETEMTIHALEMRMKTAEIETAYSERGEGSVSKLSTFRDGFRISLKILTLVKNERPMAFFSALFVMLGVASILLSIPIFVEYAKSGLVPRIPTAVGCVGLMILAFLFLICGVICDVLRVSRRQGLRLRYLALSPPAWPQPCR